MTPPEGERKKIGFEVDEAGARYKKGKKQRGTKASLRRELIMLCTYPSCNRECQYIKNVPPTPPMNLSWDSGAYGIFSLKSRSANESSGGGRGPQVEILPGHLIWDSLQIPDEEKYRLEHPWKDKVFYVEWRTKDQSNVKVYDQKRTVDYADSKVGLFYMSPFDLFVEGEAVTSKLAKVRRAYGFVISIRSSQRAHAALRPEAPHMRA